MDALTWFDLSEEDAAFVTGTLEYVGEGGFTLRFPDRTSLTIVAQNAARLRKLIGGKVTIKVRMLEGRLSASSGAIEQCAGLINGSI